MCMHNPNVSACERILGKSQMPVLQLLCDTFIAIVTTKVWLIPQRIIASVH